MAFLSITIFLQKSFLIIHLTEMLFIVKLFNMLQFDMVILETGIFYSSCNKIDISFDSAILLFLTNAFQNLVIWHSTKIMV